MTLDQLIEAHEKAGNSHELAAQIIEAMGIAEKTHFQDRVESLAIKTSEVANEQSTYLNVMPDEFQDDYENEPIIPDISSHNTTPEQWTEYMKARADWETWKRKDTDQKSWIEMINSPKGHRAMAEAHFKVASALNTLARRAY